MCFVFLTGQVANLYSGKKAITSSRQKIPSQKQAAGCILRKIHGTLKGKERYQHNASQQIGSFKDKQQSTKQLKKTYKIEVTRSLQ